LLSQHVYADVRILIKETAFFLLSSFSETITPHFCISPHQLFVSVYLHNKMVSLTAVQASNSCIASSLPLGLVAIFVGATSGIGEYTLKQFAK
jgi:hypothetical protein